jgi:hypothetical protein
MHTTKVFIQKQFTAEFDRHLYVYYKFFVGLHGDKIYSFVCGNTT